MLARFNNLFKWMRTIRIKSTWHLVRENFGTKCRVLQHSIGRYCSGKKHSKRGYTSYYIYNWYSTGTCFYLNALLQLVVHECRTVGFMMAKTTTDLLFTVARVKKAIFS